MTGVANSLNQPLVTSATLESVYAFLYSLFLTGNFFRPSERWPSSRVDNETRRVRVAVHGLLAVGNRGCQCRVEFQRRVEKFRCQATTVTGWETRETRSRFHSIARHVAIIALSRAWTRRTRAEIRFFLAQWKTGTNFKFPCYSIARYQWNIPSKNELGYFVLMRSCSVESRCLTKIDVKRGAPRKEYFGRYFTGNYPIVADSRSAFWQRW